MTKPSPKGGLMAGRRGLIMGVANERSIAWSVASALAREGADLAFTYQNEAYEVMTSIDNKCRDGLYSRHDHSHHIDGIAWQCGFMWSKFIQFNQEECYARASDGCRAAKIYLI